MTEDEIPDYEDRPQLDDEKGFATRAKQRRMRLLEDQLDDVRKDLEERVKIHKSLEKKLQREKDFKERKLDRVKKFGPHKEKGKKKRELRDKIESLRKEQWREQVRVWKGSQELLREARKINRDLTDWKRGVVYKWFYLVLKDMAKKEKKKGVRKAPLYRPPRKSPSIYPANSRYSALL